MGGTVTWNMALCDTSIMVERMSPGLMDKLSAMNITNIYGYYDFENEEFTLKMSMKVDVPQKYKDHFRKILKGDNVTSDNTDYTVTG